MFLISLAKSLPRLASMPAFLCLVVAHLEWPLTCSPRWRSSTAFAVLLCSSVSSQARSRLSSLIARAGCGAHCLVSCPHRRRLAHQLHEESVHPEVAGQLGVEAGGHQSALTDGD